MNKKNGILIGISLIIAVIMFAFVISFGIYKSSIDGLQRQAEKYMENQEYQLAATAYGKLITRTGEDIFRENRAEALKLDREYENFSFGLKKIKEEEYLSAIKYFRKIDRQESIYYEKSQQELLNIENAVLNQVRAESENGNVFLAYSILNDYLRVVGTSEEGEKVKLQLENGGEDLEDIDEESNNNGVEEISELPSDASKWVGLTVEVRTGRANLREEADLEGNIVGLAVAGDTIKIQKIFDDGGRVWCYGIITSTETGKTQTAWISSRNL